MNMRINRVLSVGVISSLLLLSGCWKKDDKPVVAPGAAGEEVLVTIDGKPALTLTEFHKFVQDAAQANQQLQIMMQLMPDFEEQLFDRAKLAEVVIFEWAKRTNITDKAEYKKFKEEAEKDLHRRIVLQMFAAEHVAKITDSDARKYYDEHKQEDPGLMVNPEGVEAKAVTFGSDAEAKNFETLMRKYNNDIDAAAKTLKKTVDQLGLVSRMSMLDQAVKTRVLALKSVPAVVVIKVNDKSFWVVKAIKRQQAQYRPFERVKEMIKESLMNKRAEEVIEKKVAEYQEKYGIKVNRAYFARKRKEHEEQRAKAMQQAKVAAPAKKGA